MRLHTLGLTLLALAPCMLVSVAQAQTTISTLPSWDNSTYVSTWGIPNTATYGQTITAPLVDNVLQSFTFELSTPSAIPYTANVYAWDGSEATGSALYQSAPMTTTGPDNTFVPVTINTGGITLASGSQYVLFLTTSGLQSGASGAGVWGQPQNQDVYNGGGFVFINNGDDATQLTTTPWSQGFLGAGADLAFSATFTPATAVPEPGSVALLVGMGLSGAGFLARRRNARRVA